MKRTIITLIISIVVYIAAYVAADYMTFEYDWIDAFVQTLGMIASVGIVGSIVVLLYLTDDNR